MQSLQTLIVDDFDYSRQSIRKILNSIGIEKIDMASAGKDVIDACKAKQYDLILCDFNLAGSKNGRQALEELRLKGILKSTSMFIIVSAETSRDIVMSIMEAKPDDYLTKPFSPSTLKERIEKLVQKNEVLKEIKQAEGLGNYKRAIALCVELINKKSPHGPWCKQKMADIFYSTSQLSKAQSICRLAQEKGPLDWAMVMEAQLMKLKGLIDKAIQHLHSTVKLFPNCMQAYDLLVEYLSEKGLFQKAQKVLQEAVKRSPSVVSRQQSLLELSLSNGDLETALKASNQALKLSVNSMHESPEQYLHSAQVIAESIFMDSSNEGRKKCQEAFNLLAIVSKKFPDDPKVKLQKCLVECRVFHNQGKMKEANDRLEEAQTLLFQEPAILTPEVSFEMGKALYALDRKEEANVIFTDLIKESRKKNKTLVAKIQAFIDEPVGNNARTQAKKYNMLGLTLYDESKYEEALDAFMKAQEYSPKHPGLNMNLVQTTFKIMSDQGVKNELISLCSDALARIGHISSQHRQYRRYQNLQSYAQRYFS
ncbi:response regulator [Marinomonas agarivorans]|nr:response regulator [Marinomonas agarivorans]